MTFFTSYANFKQYSKIHQKHHSAPHREAKLLRDPDDEIPPSLASDSPPFVSFFSLLEEHRQSKNLDNKKKTLGNSTNQAVAVAAAVGGMAGTHSTQYPEASSKNE